jgi:hypothetical protein
MFRYLPLGPLLTDAVEEVGGESDEAWLVDDRGTACRIWGFVLAPVGIGLNADATN